MLSMDYEKSLRETLERHLTQGSSATPPHLSESMRYSLLAPGKRIRPRLMLAAAEMLGLPEDVVLPAAHALEMIHCFTLIHDDLPCMDDDEMRRGQPTNHKKFGESTALLAGDSLIPLAFEVFLDTPTASDKKCPQTSHILRALKRLLWASGARGVTGGQALEETLNQNSSLQNLQSMHALKTGALFSAALLIPMDLCGITEESPEGMAIDLFAQELGLAFQVADDLEDAASEATEVTNILAYLSKSEAQNMTLTRLAQASRTLTGIFGEKTKNLRLIADEVARSIGGPTPTQIQTAAELTKPAGNQPAPSTPAKRERSARASKEK